MRAWKFFLESGILCLFPSRTYLTSLQVNVVYLRTTVHTRLSCPSSRAVGRKVPSRTIHKLDLKSDADNLSFFSLLLARIRRKRGNENATVREDMSPLYLFISHISKAKGAKEAPMEKKKEKKKREKKNTL